MVRACESPAPEKLLVSKTFEAIERAAHPSIFEAFFPRAVMPGVGAFSAEP